jgi:hypothetical protein
MDSNFERSRLRLIAALDVSGKPKTKSCLRYNYLDCAFIISLSAQALWPKWQRQRA